MKKLQTILFLALIWCNTIFVSAQGITVDDTKTPQELIENVLVNSPCAVVSGFNASGDNFTPGKKSYGYFTNGGGSFPFTEGVILSTWSSENALGPVVLNPISGFSDLGGGNTKWSGDNDLNQILNITSINATVLEFDFTPLTNFLSFDYIFASNEYKALKPCEFSDAFAFLIKENIAGSVYQNLAVIPGTSTPVSSTNIRPTIPPSRNNLGCTAVNESYFKGFNGSTSPINYAGQTVVMNSQTTVKAGKSYHIKLVIADAGNQYYDSAVFLNAGSFAPIINLGPDRLLLNNPICFGESYTIDTKLFATYDYKWYKNGVLLATEKNPSLTINDNGTYKLEVIFSPSNCFATDELKVEFTSEIALTNTILTQCDDNGDGSTIFDLTKADALIKNNNAALSQVVYYESRPNAQAKIDPILNPATYVSNPAIPVVFARVTNAFNCVNYAELRLVIANNTIAPQDPFPICDGDATQDGLYQFDLDARVTPQILIGLPAGLMVKYYANAVDAISQKNPLPNIFKNTIPNQQIIHARIVNGADCYGLTPITLDINTFSPPSFQNETIALCSGLKADLSVASGFSSYLWNTGDTTELITVSSPGKFYVTVSNTIGCEAVKEFTVISSGIATINGAIVTDFAGKDNTVLLQYTGLGNNYEFSLDGSFFQDSPIFTGIAPGKYFSYVNDKNGCGISLPFTVYVLDYPRFFTPNGDGYNDVWKIKNLDLFPQATITIYNRLGKLLKEINAINPIWNGTYLENELPSDDYWFNLDFNDGKIIKGHFSLKR